MKRISPGIALATAAIAMGGLTACGSASPPQTTTQEITIALGGDRITGWDPMQGAFWQLDMAMQGVYDTLMRWDYGSSTLSPWLATDWTFSDDGKSMEITLRDDAVFSDGVAVDAAAIEEYFDALFASPAYLYAGISNDQYGLEFTATGDYTLELTAKVPITDLAKNAVLGETPIASPEAIKDPESLVQEPVGSGPYLLESQTAGVEYILVRNPDFWDPDSIPYDKVTLKVMTDPVAQLNALKSGQIDAIGGGIPVTFLPEVEASDLNLAIGYGGYSGLSIWDPANSTEPALRDVRVREAIALAFDRETLNEALNGGLGKITSQAFVEGQPFWVEGGDERYGYDPERARELLAEAGYPDGFSVEIPVLVGAHDSTNPIVQQSLADIGITVTFKEFVDGAEWFPEAHSGKYPLIYSGSIFMFTFTHSYLDLGATGRWHVPTPEAMALITTVLEGTPEESAEASQELGEYLLDEIWDIPFSAPPDLYVSSRGVDIEVNNLFAPDLFKFTPAD
jgi:peptide/nickel transport system substrate-binding protein